MATSTFLVVYSAATRQCRKMYFLDDPEHLKQIEIHPGEGSLEFWYDLDMEVIPDVADVNQMISEKLNLPLLSGRHAVVTNGVVTAIIICDPACGDEIPGSLLIPSDTLNVGDSYTL